MSPGNEKWAVENVPDEIHWVCSADGHNKSLGTSKNVTLDCGLY